MLASDWPYPLRSLVWHMYTTAHVQGQSAFSITRVCLLVGGSVGSYYNQPLRSRWVVVITTTLLKQYMAQRVMEKQCASSASWPCVHKPFVLLSLFVPCTWIHNSFSLPKYKGHVHGQCSCTCCNNYKSHVHGRVMEKQPTATRARLVVITCVLLKQSSCETQQKFKYLLFLAVLILPSLSITSKVHSHWLTT